MSKPTVCHIFEGVNGSTAIGKAAAWGVRLALDAGYKVTVVTRELEESLKGEVEWLRMGGLDRLFFFQYATARQFIKRALGDRKFDIVHAHQPQVCSLADVFQCHFLTRVAYERNVLENRRGPRQLAVRVQQHGVLHLEDRYYGNLNPGTRMLFDSAMLRKEFTRLYGQPKDARDLVLPMPPIHFASEEDRRAAKARLLGGLHGQRLVVGFLGGIVEHKGWRRLFRALEGQDDLFLLAGGSDTSEFKWPALRGRYKGLGIVRDPDTFYAACDVVVVPSVFEPLGMVTFDVPARGIPVVATKEVGALPHVIEFNAGAEWNADEPLDPLLRSVAQRVEEFRAGALRMAEDLSSQRQGERLMQVYDEVLRAKRDLAPV